MTPEESDIRKEREICFREPHSDPDQARSAMLLLGGVTGILDLSPLSKTCLRVRYDLTQITLEEIEQALAEVGFHLDSSLIAKLRRSLWYYAEETHRANLGCEQGSSNCTRNIFVNRYHAREHGCRDERPQHWRKYL